VALKKLNRNAIVREYADLGIKKSEYSPIYKYRDLSIEDL
jgi:hypothetical protein